MAVKIRLTRRGAKKRPFYRVVVADVRSPRDGKFLEIVGHYNPILSKENKNRFVLKMDRIKYWLGNGALPTLRVEKLIKIANG